MKYYFLTGYLPDISYDEAKIRIGLGDLLGEKEHLAPGDAREIELVLLGRDVFNLDRLLSGKAAVMEHSVYGADFWRDQIKSPREGPDFILDFLESLGAAYGPREGDRLYAAYYDFVLGTSRNEFLRSFFLFRRDLLNAAAAVRARRLGLAPAEFLVGEGEVVEALSGSNAEDFGLSRELPWIERVIAADDPNDIRELFDKLEWDYLTEAAGPDPFDFKAILSYLLRLEQLEKRLALNEEAGMAKVQRLEGN